MCEMRTNAAGGGHEQLLQFELQLIEQHLALGKLHQQFYAWA